MGFIIPEKKDSRKHEHNFPIYNSDMRKIRPDWSTLNNLRKGILWKCSCGRIFKWTDLEVGFLTTDEVQSYVNALVKSDRLLGEWKKLSYVFHFPTYVKYRNERHHS